MSGSMTKERLQEHVDRGQLKVEVCTAVRNLPISGAKVMISNTGEPEKILEILTTDESGFTPEVVLPTPPLEYSLSSQGEQPYSEYNLHIEKEGFLAADIAGTELFSGQTSMQKVFMDPETPEHSFERVVIEPHALFAQYPEKIPEEEIKPRIQSGEIVLSRVVVPEYIVVHDGPPSDSVAKDYYVPYRDYIKNVACSEIYSTWTEAAIRANVLAIMSFTMNRVYTEWYRNKGYDFTITSSTAYDHKWIYGRNIFENISRIVDRIFQDYLSRPNVRQPILTQYCDGRKVSCPGWMTQWGSQALGQQGYKDIEILRYYYGDDMYINRAEKIAGIPASWPGHDLEIGSSGLKVRQIQEQINVIAQAYPALPEVEVDGIYGKETQKAVKKFQEIFGLPASGIVDYPTWYKIQGIYVGVSRIAELR